MNNKSRHLFYIVIASIAVLYSIIYYFTPLLIDDLQFIAAYHRFSSGSDSFSIEAWKSYIGLLRELDNSRISNMMSPFSTIISPWKDLFPFISGIVTAGIVWLMTRITGFRYHASILASVIWFMIVLFLPWRNNILVADYQLNYTYSAFINLSFILLLVKYESNEWNRYIFVPMLLLAVTAGGWHEGFAFPIAGGFAMWALNHKLKMSRYWYTLSVIYVLSALVFALSPGMLDRAVREVEKPMPVDYIKFTADLILVFFTTAAFLLCYILKKTRKCVQRTLREPLFIIFATSMILSTMLSIVFDHTARTAFWPELCAIITLLLLLKPIIYPILELKKVSYPIAIICYVLCFCHSCLIIDWQKKFHDENDTIMSAIKNGESTVYYDIIMPESVPVHTLYFPTRTHWITPFHYRSLENAYRLSDISVVPETLRNVTIENSRIINKDLNLYAKDDALWMYDNPQIDTFHEIYMDITLNDGTILYNHPTYIRHFKTTDGRKLLYLKPHKIHSGNIIAATNSIP